MEFFKLNNGTQMPMAGIGVFTFTPAEAQAAIESALRDGIRLIDTANAYQNEKATGRAMKASGVKREDIYLVTKLWPSVYESETAVDDTLRRLDTDYIDLLFLHQLRQRCRQQLFRPPHPAVFLLFSFCHKGSFFLNTFQRSVE